MSKFVRGHHGMLDWVADVALVVGLVTLLFVYTSTSVSAVDSDAWFDVLRAYGIIVASLCASMALGQARRGSYRRLGMSDLQSAAGSIGLAVICIGYCGVLITRLGLPPEWWGFPTADVGFTALLIGLWGGRLRSEL